MWEPHVPPSHHPDWRALSAQAGLDERELRAACRRRRYARGDTIFHEGDPAGAFHLLDVGRVAVRLTTSLGDDTIVDVLRPGDTFGEQALIDRGTDRSASVTALEKVETLTVDAAGFDRLFEGSTAASRFLLLVLSNRLRATSHQLLEARYLTAERRLHRCLVRLAEVFGAGDGGTIPLTQTDIASMTGVTRSTANRLLRRAEQEGAIAISRGRIAVRDAAALDRRAR
jgi:CRP-like cAMP-binding protein